jgi:predicted RNA-binding Zn-ribbon protein involved in translation (DUF1610 family)
MLATHQTWKFHVGTLAYVVSLPLTIWGCIHLALSGDYRVLLLAFSVGFSGLAFCSLAIRCPKCGAHWYWTHFWPHIKRPMLGWARKLFAQTDCPKCGFRVENDA